MDGVMNGFSLHIEPPSYKRKRIDKQSEVIHVYRSKRLHPGNFLGIKSKVVRVQTAKYTSRRCDPDIGKCRKID